MILRELSLMDIALDQSCRVVELTGSIERASLVLTVDFLELTGS